MKDFYSDTVAALIEKKEIQLADTILVTCGAHVDREALIKVGLNNVTISNVDQRISGSEFAPFRWSFQNAESLEFLDNSFDFVIAHSGLHHCRSPHRALLEMYRVAKKGILVFEPKDGWLLRLGTRLGFGQEYEIAAVMANDWVRGGVANSAVPNYVYRWSKRDVEKTINSNAPEMKHTIRYFYALRIPEGALALQEKRIRLALSNFLQLFSGLARFFPLFANNIAFFILKPQGLADLQPWLGLQSGEVRLRPEFKRFASSHGGGTLPR